MRYTIDKLIFLALVPSILLLTGFRQLDAPEDGFERGSRSPQSFGAMSSDASEQDWKPASDAVGKSLDARSEVIPSQAERYGVQEFSIIATENGFYPSKVIVRRNIPVNLYLTTVDAQSSCFVMKNDDFSFHRGIGAKKVERISFKPMQVGVLKFHCPVGNIEGVLIVRD